MTTIETILRGNQCSCRAKGIYVSTIQTIASYGASAKKSKLSKLINGVICINNIDNSLIKDNLDNLGDNEDNGIQ